MVAGALREAHVSQDDDLEAKTSPLKQHRDRDRGLPSYVQNYAPSRGLQYILQHWRKAVRIALTVLLYTTFSHSYLTHDVPTVVYTCSSGKQIVAPRAVNTRWDTIIETVESEGGDHVSDFFCKVRVALEMVHRHPGKRIVYVDTDMVVDLKAVIEDIGCSRLSFFVHPWPGGSQIVQTPFFCFPADAGSQKLLQIWWDIRGRYPKNPKGLKDQAAMNDMVVTMQKNETVTVLTSDPTGVMIAHCSHAVGDKRDDCRRNLDFFSYWDRSIVLLLSAVSFVLWLLPLCMVCGFPLPMPGVFGSLLQVNPLTILAALGLPRVISTFMVRNNRVSGTIGARFMRMFSGFIFVTIGPWHRLWVPTIGLLQLPRDPAVLHRGVGYIALFCCMVAYRKQLDTWTCITCPTLYHWLSWSKTSSDRCSSLAGAGKWLAVVPSGPSSYHLVCGANTRGEMGVAAELVHGVPAQEGMRGDGGLARRGASKGSMFEHDGSDSTC